MAKGAAAAASSKVDVGEVKMKHVKRDLVEAALVEQGESEKVLKGHSAEGVVMILQNGYRASHEKKDLTMCTKCRGISPLALEACPYCGFAGDEEGKAVSADEHDAAVVGDREPPRTSGIQVKLTEKDLDASIAKILELKQRGATTFWQLGSALADLYRGDQWKLRVESGKQKYKSFKQCIDAEIKISMPHVMNMIDVAREFTEAQVSHVGGKKLSFLLMLPKALKTERQEVMEEIERGATVREVKEKVRKVREKHGITAAPRERENKKLQKSGLKGRAKQLKQTTNKMTIAMIEGVSRLEMFAKPSGKVDAEKLKDGKRAKNVGDEPIAIETLPNGIFCVYSVLKSSKGWVLKIERRRAS